MKSHLIKSNKESNTSACGRNIYLGANRSRDILILSPKDFFESYKRNSDFCCKDCMKIFNERVLKSKGVTK